MADLGLSSATTANATDAKSLVCSKCWQDLFSTPDFQQLCVAPFKSDGQGGAAVVRCTYASSLLVTRASAGEGCQWCKSILEILKYETWGEAKFDRLLRRRPTLRPFKIQVTGHVHDDEVAPRIDLLPDEDMLPCQCTPPGNNELKVFIYMDGKLSLQCLELFRNERTDLTTTVTANEVHVNLTHSHVWSEARQWLEDCAQHACCPATAPTPLPNRVIDVQSDPTRSTVRLIDGRSMSGFYVALSYCWGGAQSGLTNIDNLEQRQTSLSVHTLSLTIQHAIWVARQLGIHYLWIDAICIVQDSLEDKTRELKSMAAVYQQAYVTIIAASSASASDGFLSDLPMPYNSIYDLPFWTREKRLTQVVGRRRRELSITDRDLLEKRAWAFQENLLSARRILFTKTSMQYECRRHRVCLGGSHYRSLDGLLSRVFVNLDSIMMRVLEGPIERTQTIFASRRTRHESARMIRAVMLGAWQDIIFEYTKRSLTFQQDVSSALAAVAEVFQPYVGQRYLAGLWDGPMLPSLLLWRALAYKPPNIRSRTDYLAPTWSWASKKYPVTYPSVYYADGVFWEAHLICVHVGPKYESLPYGPVGSGYMRLRAKVRRAHYESSSVAQRWYDGIHCNNMTWYAPGHEGDTRSELDKSSRARVSIDPIMRGQNGDILCLALFRSVEKSINERRIHGLFAVETEEHGIYQRVGMFYNMGPGDFDACETLTLSLV